MKLYEIDAAIMSLLAQLDVDEETGEILAGSEEISRQLDALDMERSRILEYLAKVVLETRSDIIALKAEEIRLADRRRRLEKREDRLMQVLDRECAGRKTDLGVATFRYRRTSRVEVDDPASAIGWLQQHDLRDCIRVHEPEVDKTAVKRILQEGTSVPGVSLVSHLSCSLK